MDVLGYWHQIFLDYSPDLFKCILPPSGKSLFKQKPSMACQNNLSYNLNLTSWRSVKFKKLCNDSTPNTENFMKMSWKWQQQQHSSVLRCWQTAPHVQWSECWRQRTATSLMATSNKTVPTELLICWSLRRINSGVFLWGFKTGQLNKGTLSCHWMKSFRTWTQEMTERINIWAFIHSIQQRITGQTELMTQQRLNTKQTKLMKEWSAGGETGRRHTHEGN